MAASFKGFSIRGYVSKMRGVDVRKCWPFAGEEEEGKLQPEVMQRLLPPIEFRPASWWLHELEREMTAEAEEPVVGPVEEDAVVGEEGVAAIPEAVGEGEKEVEREPAALKVCPVCERFTASTINAVNAHIDRCLEEAAPKVERQQRRGKSKAPKKRSLAELFAIFPPVAPAGDNNNHGEEQEEEESQASQQQEVVTKKRKNSNNLNQNQTKWKKVEMIQKRLIKGQSQKLRVPSGYNYTGVLKSTSLRGRQRYKAVTSIILQKRKQARRSLRPIKSQMNVRRSWLIANRHKDASSTDEAASTVVDHPMENSAQFFLTDKVEEVNGRIQELGSDGAVISNLVEKAQTADENVGALCLEKMVDLNQEIQDMNDVQMLSTGPSTSPKCVHPVEGTAPKVAIQTERSVQREHSSFEMLPISFAAPPACSPIEASASSHQIDVGTNSRQPWQLLETVRHNMDLQLLQNPHLSHFPANTSLEINKLLAQRNVQSGEARNNLQQLQVCRERCLNEGFIGLPLNSQGELIHFHLDDMAGLTPVLKRQRESRQFDHPQLYSFPGPSNGSQFSGGKVSYASAFSGLFASGLGLRNPERIGNVCQESNLMSSSQRRPNIYDKSPSRTLGMQSAPGRDNSKPASQAVKQQTVRLMGKNVTVGKLNDPEQCCDEGRLRKGKDIATGGAFHSVNFGESPMSRLHSVQNLSKDGASFSKEAAKSKRLPRVVPVRSVEASSSSRGLDVRSYLMARRNHCSEAQQLVHQFPFHLPEGFLPGKNAGRLSFNSSDRDSVGLTQSSSECLPNWLLDATRQQKSMNFSAYPFTLRPSPISEQNPRPGLSTLPSLALQWPSPADRFADSASPSRITNEEVPGAASRMDSNVGLGHFSSEPHRDQMEGSRVVPDICSKSDSATRSGPLKLNAGARHILKPSPNVDQGNRPIHSTMPSNGVVACRNFQNRPSKVFKI